WQINARTVTHDTQERKVEYDDAWFEVYGVPVAYTPYFSHPDGTVKRKSGLVSPSAGYKSNLGMFVGANYYYDLAPDRDMTVGAILYSEETPILTGEYRQRWSDARLEVEGGVTKSERDDRIAGVTQTVDDEVRGHILGEGLWELNEKWRAGTNIAWASDDQYMRQYDFVNDDVLENELYAERFSGRDYFVGRFLTFQDIRVREERVEDQPEVLPEMVASFMGEPGQIPLIGGRWNLDASFLGLRRAGSDQDMNRFSIGGGWQRRLISDYGLVAKAEANMRADIYNTRDSNISEIYPSRAETQTESRLFPQVNTEVSYPLQRPFENFQAVVEPVAGLTVAPNIDMTRNIPNEDSQDAQIDYSNLFEPNRFPGYDRVEDQSRVTYGLRSGLYGYNGNYGNVFFGQSYRLQEDDNPFPRGSGLDRQTSDFVGQAAFLLGDTNFDYQFQLAGDNLSSQRHEVDFYTVIDRFDLSSRYLFAKALEGTDINESREQVQAAAGFYVSPEWRIRLGGTRDLGGEDSGLREADVGLDFFGPCVSWALTGRRSLTDDASGESDTEVLFTIGLKNLGEFRQSGYPRR
ncbi:MAG: LPS assembly protein LptD, partial [Alphaproteobacteria bacterium]|nr:LPS assembly protein LptD [Alphaproteobacteria bacterium]